MDYFRTSPLFLVISSDNDLPQVRQLLASGKSPNSQVYGGFTPLHEAICKPEENFRVFQELINAGADLNLGTHLGYTPLHFAVIHRKRRIVDALIQLGADVNAKTFLGHTALQYAVTKYLLRIQPDDYNIQPDLWIINKLLKHRAIDCNAVDSMGNTALMVAVKCRQSRAVSMLLNNGADPNICNKDLDSPLHVAFAQPLSFIEIRLLQSGANINYVNKNGQTPLDLLFKYNKRSIHNVTSLFKLVVFKYNIVKDMKQKLECDPDTSQFLNNCCDEVKRMRTDFIFRNVTMHDFIWNCFNDNQFKNILLQVHKPVVDRLVRDVYPEYFSDIFQKIPESSLHKILEITVRTETDLQFMQVTELGYLLVKSDVIPLVCKFLSKVEVLCLIAAFTNIKISKSMQNIHERILSYVVYLNWKDKVTFPKIM